MTQRLNKVPSCGIKTPLTLRWPARSVSSDRVGPALSCATFSCTGQFQDLQDSLKGIAPATLSERLRTLEENGVVERRFYSMSPPRAEYVLTAKGRDLGPIVRAMREWGRKYAR